MLLKFSGSILFSRRKNVRPSLYWTDYPVFCGLVWLHRGLRTADGGKAMNALYLIVGAITIALFVYLVLALLKPEWFG
jgi:K+-transporting ATPase KdpF subunit